MARVPVVDGPQVRTQALPGARVQVATPDDAFGAVQARELGQLSQGLGQVASAFERAQQEANQSRVDDALNQLREAELDLTYSEQNGYTRLKGVQALQRPDNKPLSDEYYERLNARTSELAQGLGNEAQRQLFQQRAAERLARFRGNLMNYEGQENTNYQLSVASGTIATASREMAAFYNDPARIDQSVMSIRAAAAKDGRLRGLSAVQIEDRTTKLVSAAHLGAIEQALATNNPLYAEQYLRTYKSQMDPADLLKARASVDELASVYIGNAKANQAFTVYTQADNPTDMDRVTAITMQTESGGQRFGADGQLLTSPAGAKGEMQVMDGTNLDPGYGVRPAADDSPEERARVGRDYLHAMVREYDGNLAHAWAAYNAGPGAVNQALKEAADEGNPAGWLDKLPTETQNYVAKNLQAYAKGEGRPATPSLEELHARLDADPDLRTRPKALQKAREELNRRYALYTKGQAETRSNAFAEGMRHIENGGRYDTIPREIRDQVDPSKWDDLRKYEETVRGNGRQHSDLATYQLLASDPERVRNMSESEFYAQRQYLSESDFKKFSDMRGRTPTGEKAPGTLDQAMVNSVVDSRLQSMGLDPKAKSGTALARVGAIRKTINDEVLLRQQAEGRAFNDAEITKVVDELFLKTRSFKNESWLSRFMGNADEVRKATLFGATVGDIPKELRAAIEADFRAQGIDEPTDQQMLEAFFMGDLRQQ